MIDKEKLSIMSEVMSLTGATRRPSVNETAYGTIDRMPTPPESTKSSLSHRVHARARERWPALTHLNVRFRGGFAYINGDLPDGTTQPLCRLRYAGYANQWGFAIYLASKDKYEDSYLPSGSPAGTAEEALDCACGLYLTDPSAWTPE